MPPSTAMKTDLHLPFCILHSAFCIALTAFAARAELVVYPEYPPQIERDYAYRVTVSQGSESRAIPVYNHCEKSALSRRTRGGDVNRRFCEFAFSDATVRVDIAVCEDVRSYSVFPSRLGLRHAFRDGVISVWLDHPALFGIRLNDYDKTILSVFADPPEDPASIPRKGDPGVLFVDGWLDATAEDGIIVIDGSQTSGRLVEPSLPGAPEVDGVPKDSGRDASTTRPPCAPLREVYIAPGAVLNARLIVKTPKAFVHGRGMVLDPFSDIFRFNQTNNTRRVAVNVSANDAVVEDIKIVDARTFNFGSWASRVTFRNVKALSSMMCTDGITSGGEGLRVEGAWLYVGDNGLVISGVKDAVYRSVAIGTSCNAIFPQLGNENVLMEDIDVFRADEGLVKNTYNGVLRRRVKWKELDVTEAEWERGPQDLTPRRQSFLICNLCAVDCILFSRFFVGGNMGKLPKRFVFENLSIPYSTGDTNWRSIGKTNGVAVTIYDDPSKWLVTDNYTLAITNLWLGGKRASGFAPETVRNGHLASIKVTNVPLRGGPDGFDSGRDASTTRPPIAVTPDRREVNWICPWKVHVSDALLRDWRQANPASGERRLPSPPQNENLLADRSATRSVWQRHPSWMAKLEATETEAGARIYRLIQCERGAGMLNVITDRFLQHGPGKYRLAFDAAAKAGEPIPLTAVVLSNEKDFKAEFTLPADGQWRHYEVELVLDFDHAVTDLVAIHLKSGIPTDELRFKNLSLTNRFFMEETTR